MQVLVMYFSHSGNTEKMAMHVAEGVNRVDGVECLVKRCEDVSQDDLIQSQGIIAGSPVYFGTMAAELKKVLDKNVTIRSKMEDKVGAAFCTAGDATGGKETTMTSIIHALMIYGMIIVGDPLSATGHYGVGCTGAADEQAATNASKLGQRVGELVTKLQ